MVTLGQAIQSMMQARGLNPRDVEDRLEGRISRATFWRILTGSTQDPKVASLLDLCRALGCSPTELLELAEAWAYRERSTDILDIRLRRTFSRVQQFPPRVKGLAVAQIEALVEPLEALGVQEIA